MTGMEESVGNCPFLLVLHQLCSRLPAFPQLTQGGSSDMLDGLGAEMKLPSSPVLQSCL